MPANTMNLKNWDLLVVLSVLWGGSFFFVEVALTELPPLTIVSLRVGIAAVALWLFVMISGGKLPRTIKIWVAFTGMAILNNAIPFSLIAWSQTEITSGFASILNATTPLFTVVVAGTLLADERITKMKAVGVLAGFTGVVVMIGPDALGGLGATSLAPLAVLVAALSYAFAGVFGRRFQKLGVDPTVTAAGQVTVATLMLAPLAILIESPFSLPFPGIETWSAVIGLALLSTAVAYFLYFRILAASGATNLLLVTFLIPISALLLGIGILGETLLLRHAAGLFLIALGLSAIDARLWRRSH
jgi:drug/metabolite transporter (DMT)-like permease